tara:strand:+ start:1342 stop:2493 length:1152 start_codon:yes stop_codon:yes gene_type:complete
MLRKNIFYRNFKSNTGNKKKFLRIFKNLFKSPNQVLSSLGSNYKDSYNKKLLNKLNKFENFRLIGMGGSILGAKAIYSFLTPKLKKFQFIDNFSSNYFKKNKKKNLTLIISKSGNTLETISNVNVLINRNEKNIFITEQKKSYLTDLANKLKAEIISHNNYIGGRYSVLSEVGMLPAQLMGFKPEKFRRLNYLIKDKTFNKSLIQNVSSILSLIKHKKNSVILNYDQKSDELFKWYQQLVAESLGKKSKGILPVISTMPQDNHSLMQYYLDGTKINFFTLYFFKEKKSTKIKSNQILKTHNYLKDKNLNDILFSQFSATEKVFKKKNIPFRSLILFNRNEETLGELFTFFILETILLGMALNVNPYDQPAVELIKKESKKILI